MKTEFKDKEAWEDEFAATVTCLADWPEAGVDARHSARIARTLVRNLRRERESSYLFPLACAGTAALLFLVLSLLTGSWGSALQPVYFLAAAGGLAVATVPLLLTIVPQKNGRLTR